MQLLPSRFKAFNTVSRGSRYSARVPLSLATSASDRDSAVLVAC